jgi:hypothetical protein
MVRLLLDRVVAPGFSAAGHVVWYLTYHASGGTVTRSADRAAIEGAELAEVS